MRKADNLSFCVQSLEPWFVARQLSIMSFLFCLYLWNQTCCLHAFANTKALKALPWKVQLVWSKLQKHFKGWEAKQESVFSGLLLFLWCSAVSDPTAPTLPALHFTCHTFVIAVVTPACHQSASPGSVSSFCCVCEQGKGEALQPSELGTMAAIWAEGSCRFLAVPVLYTLQPHASVPCCAFWLSWPVCTGEWGVTSY